MKKGTIEKNIILSLSEKEYYELQSIVEYADKYGRGYKYNCYSADDTKRAKTLVALLRKWCKAFDVMSLAYLSKRDDVYCD